MVYKYKRQFRYENQSQIVAQNQSGKPKRSGDCYNRECVICKSRTTYMYQNTRRRRLDGEFYMRTPKWFRSKLEPGKFECKKCYSRSYYEKNWLIIRNKQRAYYRMRKRLHDWKLKRISKLA